MAAWRERALRLFPALKGEITRPDATPMQLFFELLPLVRNAHEAGDENTLRRVYTFAEWCLAQSSETLWNAAGVAFYEHLFDGPEEGWAAVAPWLSPPVIWMVHELWEARLSSGQMERLQHLLTRRPTTQYMSLPFPWMHLHAMADRIAIPSDVMRYVARRREG